MVEAPWESPANVQAIVDRAAKLFPETAHDPGRVIADVGKFGEGRVWMALQVAFLAFAHPGKEDPRGYRFMLGIMRNWGKRSEAGIKDELDAQRAIVLAAMPRPVAVLETPVRRLEPGPVYQPGAMREFLAALARGDGQEAAIAALATKQIHPGGATNSTGAGDSWQSTPRPAGNSAGNAADVVTNDHQWSGRGSNPQPPHCERGAPDDVPLQRDASGDEPEIEPLGDGKRPVSNAALQPDCPDSANYNLNLPQVQPTTSHPEPGAS